MFVSTLALAAALPSPQEICGPACASEAVTAPASTEQILPSAPASQLAYLQETSQSSAPPVPQPEDSSATPDTPAVEQDPAPSAEQDDNTIVVTGEIGPPSEDPAEELNVAAYEAVQEIDEIFVEPIAEIYDEALPKPIRSGLRNFISNIAEPVNFLNFLLQFKIGKALKSAGRFAINSTIGVAGLFEVASKKPFSLEHETNGFANTLGFYGVGPGPYLYLPLIGSTTVRDLVGRIADVSVLPQLAGPPFNKPIYSIPIATLNSLETRIRTDEQVDAIKERCGDPYSATRDFYLIQRQVEIDSLRGKPSDDLAELIERVEFNCDIDILIGEGVGMNAEEFINENTNLVEEFEAPVEQEGDDPATETNQTLDPATEETGTDSSGASDGNSIEPVRGVEIADEPVNDNPVTGEEPMAQPAA